ncbi:ankyrin repeat domain-containing protein [Marinomonas posidonica]|uniref:ankyrin repeat domain-containing protein n=1 Tax=Marinomonas posidonica TaxID=936476 RepID=UPI00373603C9
MRKYLPIFLLSSPLLFASPYDSCLSLTAHERFSELSGFVEYDDIDWRQALPVCEQAVAEHPDDYKALYSLSRVYSRQYDELGGKEIQETFYDYMVKSYWAGFGHAAWVLAMENLESEKWDQAIYWIDLNIKDGSVRAVNKKALWLYSNNEVYPNKNYQEAVALLKTAADSDNQYIHYNLAALHYYDIYEMVDYDFALTHFKKAADLGHPSSLYVLGEIYHNGFGTKKDPIKSTEYYLAAKEAGSTIKNLDQRLSQSAMNAWLSSEEYEYYDLSINTLRSLAFNGDHEAITFLRQQRIASLPDNTPLDYFLVHTQGEAYLERASKYLDRYIENQNAEDRKKVYKAWNGYVDVMVANGVYSDPIAYFSHVVEQGYGPFFEVSQLHLSKMYTFLFIDYKSKYDGIKALTAAMLTDEKEIVEEVAHSIFIATDRESYEDILVAADRNYRNYNIDFVINRYEQALKNNRLGLATTYIKESSIGIDDRRSTDGVSMLHLAIWHNHTDIAMLLIDEGADINLADRQGHKPLGYAIHKQNIKLTKYLNGLGAKN